MRDSKLANPDMFGPYHNEHYALQLGDTQQMQFAATDEGPCYLSEKERKDNKCDQATGKFRECDVLKADLIEALKHPGTTQKEKRPNCKRWQSNTTYHLHIKRL